MKEYEVKGLLELKRNYEGKLEDVKEYQDIRNEFQEESLALVKEALESKGIKPEETHILLEAPAHNCGFCTLCVTTCVSCVFHVGGDPVE
jgi:hypothetical protein